MAWTRDTTKSIRENIMARLEDRFLAMTAGVDGFSTTWKTVSRKPLTKDQIASGDALALFDVAERELKEIGFTLRTLQVAIEFWAVVAPEGSPATALNTLLLDVQREMSADLNMSGLTLNVEQQSSEMAVDGPKDDEVAGVAFYSITYRTKRDDPRKLLGEA